MKQVNATQSNIVVLTADQISHVSGGATPAITPVKPIEVKAQDMYGNTMSAEDYAAWTAREHDWWLGDNINDFPGGKGQQ